MNKYHSLCLLGAVLLLSGACSNVRQAPVAERPNTGAAPEAAAGRAPGPEDAPGVRAMDDADQAGDEFGGTWTELPQPQAPPPGGAPETGPWAQPGRVSDNPAVIALLDDTDTRLSQGNDEGAVSSVERALRLEPKNPWLWHRLAVLRLQQGQWRQAMALAEKSNSLSIKHPQVRKANAAVIKLAGERMKGDR